jgi:hypothetical protein
MRWRPGMMTAVAVLGTAFLTGAGAATAASAATAADAVTGAGAAATAVAAAQSGTWGTAAEIPGSNLLNHGGQATINAVSCAASGNCAAGGSYTSGFSSTAPIVQAFVADKTKNIWRRAEEVPGTASLNTGGNAKINTVSCAAQGDCSAGGYYTDSSGHQQALVVTQTNGTWGNAEEVPGSGGLNAGGYARVLSVSCGAAGGCSAGGVYSTSSVDGIPTVQAMVVSETNGTWGTAEEVPGTAALNGGGYAAINSVSCPSAGNCSAGGSYTSTTPATQAFTVAETNGTWGNAQPVPGIAALNNGGLAQLNSVSCSSVGNCSAGGFYLDSSFNSQAFVVGESGGTWGSAEEVPGTAALDQQSPGAATGSVSCSAPGDCSAGGSYTDASGAQQAFVVNQAGGTWGSAEEVPGTAPLNGGGQASIQSVSCAPGGLCSAVGQYENVKLNTQVFAVSQS